MAKVTSFRVVVGGQEKEIFYVLEKANGGLTLIPRHQGYYTDDPTVRPGNPTLENRFSIHVTPNNPDGNLIHRTVVTRDAAIDTCSWTDAVKKKTGFAPVFWKICCDLRNGFDPHRHNNIVRVGEYDPDQFTLYYAVLVSAPEIRFNGWTRSQLTADLRSHLYSYTFERKPHFYLVDHAFPRFRITLMVSYLACSSDRMEHLAHHITIREDDPRLSRVLSIAMSHLTKGIPEALAARLFENRRIYLVDKLAASKVGWPDSDRELLKSSLHSTPYSNDPDFQSRMLLGAEKKS